MTRKLLLRLMFLLFGCVLEQGCVTSARQKDVNEEEVTTAPLDISSEIESDFVLLPEAEVRYTYQDLALSTEQVLQWGETDKYANTAGTRVMTEPDKGRKRTGEYRRILNSPLFF